ncbi:MAG: hypothetical protein M1818_006601 [Claussenomyces sp. TS43310]|nr:MAG: hypothetical protein M1818_006964 [Claussenomyces sp. TS43310]KAI9735024.1 MAG: hypothetical protein M1818_006601 [Claussenomyces sp. TS43310]
MAISLSFFPILLALLLSCPKSTKAGTVTYNFTVGWVNANPDGLFTRPTIGVNGQWPWPVMRATVNDTVIVHVDNQLGNQSTTLHFHGLYMNGSSEMDGPDQVAQCGIPPGSQLTYNFTIRQAGTYWYHSHSRGQYPDGMRAPFIIDDPDNPYAGKYDEEVVISVSDWYHEQVATLLPRFINRANPTGAEPVPNSALFNETQNLTVSIEPGKIYYFRMVNVGAFAGQYIWFENHTMSIIEVDGVYTEQADADMIYLSAAQRCSFLLTAKDDTSSNFPFVASMDTSLFDTIPDGLNYNVTGWLVYDAVKDLPDPAFLDELDEFDDMNLVPYDKQTLLEDPDQSIELTVIMDNLGDGANYAFFNNISYVAPKVPTLYTALSAGILATDPAVYGEYSQPFVLGKGQVIEIVVNNDDTGKHPFHLHGHNFQSIARSDDNAGFYNASDPPNFPVTPMRRDTLVLKPQGYMVLRFRADNAGVWLFHCHIQWHTDSGLIATMIEMPMELQKTVTVPTDHLAACRAGGVATSGNAAGNTADFLDLTGQHEAVAPLPNGFTARGIVALTFSAIAALLGLVVITWYGLADMGTASLEAEKQRIAAANIAAPARSVG